MDTVIEEKKVGVYSKSDDIMVSLNDYERLRADYILLREENIEQFHMINRLKEKVKRLNIRAVLLVLLMLMIGLIKMISSLN